MIKKDFIKALSENTGLTVEASAKAVEGMMKTMSDAFKQGESITLRGFGAFEVKTMTGRKGRDIRKGKTIDLPDARRVKFAPCKELKEAMKL